MATLWYFLSEICSCILASPCIKMNNNRFSYAATELILVEIFSDIESQWQMDGCAKTGQCIIHHCSSLESVAVYCICC